MSQNKPTITIIGGGRAGASLAFYFSRQGQRILSLSERNPERFDFLQQTFNWPFLTQHIEVPTLQDSRIVLICIHDNQVAEVARSLSEKLPSWRNKVVAHTSGALPAKVLNPLKKKGAAVASMHPVYSFSKDPRENHLLRNIWFNLEGDSEALNQLEELFRFTQNRILRVDESRKEAVHLACVFYANFYVALAQISKEILQDIPLEEPEIFEMLNPLLRSSVDQVLAHGTAKGLTGPIKRGDTRTIQAHLELMQKNFPDKIPLYRELSLKLLELSSLLPGDKITLEKLLAGYSYEGSTE
ncbi:MAG: Rossmann-like and DUF2520 domain-containing protein [Calditrichia bacterium]